MIELLLLGIIIGVVIGFVGTLVMLANALFETWYDR